MPIRVLIAHNRHRQRGGEDVVVDDEALMLRSRGHEVELYLRDNHELEQTPQAGATLPAMWSQRTTREVGTLLDRFQPDVLHVHNTFPLISPSIYWAASKRRVPVVQTLHNFRLVCPQGMMLRDGKPCEDCVGHWPWRGVVHACHRNSRGQSAALAAMLVAHRGAGTWQHRVTRYIAFNEFCRERFIAGGLPAEKISVKPNGVDLPLLEDMPRMGFLFVGRLAPEKGLRVLAEAASLEGLQSDIRVIGGGPEAYVVEGHTRLRALGALSPASVYEEMRRAVALVMPSLWYETTPRQYVEAFALGLPVIASRIGALASLVDDGRTGILFEPGNAADLASKLRWAESHPDRMFAMGMAARREYERDLTNDANYRRLLAIYGEAIASVARPEARP